MKLSIYKPCKPYWLGQGFGENKACSFPDKTGVVSELPDGTCPAGKVKLYPLLGMKGHTGLDLYATHGQRLYAAMGGTISQIYTEIERGLGIEIVSNEKYDFGTLGEHYAKIRYWHLMSIDVKQGQTVKAGDFIGLADNTGLSAGDHLHFELKPCEFDIMNKPYNVYQSNGYYGAIDPVPFLDVKYAEDIPKIINLSTALVVALEKLIALLKRR